jgi:hypothetical protein
MKYAWEFVSKYILRHLFFNKDIQELKKGDKKGKNIETLKFMKETKVGRLLFYGMNS